MTKKIGILFEDDGKIILETDGYKGEACVDETIKLIEQLKALGVDVETLDVKPKDEAHEIEGAKTRQKA